MQDGKKRTKRKSATSRDEIEQAHAIQTEKLDHANAMLTALYWATADTIAISKNLELRHFGSVTRDFIAKTLANLRGVSEEEIECHLLQDREEMNALEAETGKYSPVESDIAKDRVLH